MIGFQRNVNEGPNGRERRSQSAHWSPKIKEPQRNITGSARESRERKGLIQICDTLIKFGEPCKETRESKSPRAAGPVLLKVNIKTF